MKPVIVGIDPGTTTAYAVVDTKGLLIETASSKSFDMGTLISEVIRHGNPFLVGCDKKNPPGFVEKFAIRVGARLAWPRHDLLQEEKKQMVSRKMPNDHELDAYASALYAYKEYEELILRTGRILKDEGKEELEEDIIPLIVQEGMSIRDALKELEKEEELEIDEGEPAVRVNVVRPTKEIEKLQKRITSLEQDAEKKRGIIQELKKENRKLKKRIKGMPVPKVVKQKEGNIQKMSKSLDRKKQEVQELDDRLGRLKGFMAASSGKSLAKKLRNLSRREFEEKSWLGISHGDVLLVDDVNVASAAVLEKIRGKVGVIVYRNKLSVRHEGFAFISAKGLDIAEEKDFALIPEKQIRDAAASREVLRNLIIEYKQKREA